MASDPFPGRVEADGVVVARGTFVAHDCILRSDGPVMTLYVRELPELGASRRRFVLLVEGLRPFEVTAAPRRAPNRGGHPAVILEQRRGGERIEIVRHAGIATATSPGEVSVRCTKTS